MNISLKNSSYNNTVLKPIKAAIICTAFSLCLLNGQLIQESGSLMEFIGGEAPQLAYDNYISHVSEGIAAPGYNDYGPDWLDTQTNGFGDYNLIEVNSPTLDYWRLIFDNLLEQNIQTVNSMLEDSSDSFYYEFVEFTDTVYNRVYYLLREQLDSSFIDSNVSGIFDDDVIGSFQNGWGLFIFNPGASRSNLLIEVPHPCDDFIAPYLATELFLQCDGMALMIAGAGREVKWSGSGSYNNNKSRSDPSRNANTVFQVFHEALSDSLKNQGPHSPLVLHTHSFDNSHTGANSIILSAGALQPYANKPIRDITADHYDFVNFTTEFPIDENLFGLHLPVCVVDYYQVHYSGEFHYYGSENVYEISHSDELLGPWNGVQMVYLHQSYNSRDVYEPWVQVELDEKPELFDQLDMPLEDLYSGPYPTSYHNYALLLQYYQPFVNAVNAYLTNWETVPDTTAPADIEPLYPSELGIEYVKLHWNPVDDTNFKTYRILIEPDSSEDGITIWDRGVFSGLADMRRSSVTINNLEVNTDYSFRILAEDYFDNVSDTSAPAYNYIPGHAPPVVITDFEDDSLTLSSYPGQDFQPDAWSLDTNITSNHSLVSLKLTGNTWKLLSITPPEIDSSTTWLADAYIERVGEIQGIGIIDSLNSLFYSFAGTQEVNPDEWIPVYQGYFEEDRWATYYLPIGADWLAYFDYLPVLDGLIFINDQDTDTAGTVYFDNIIDITTDLSIAPQAVINFESGRIYRSIDRQRSVDINFSAEIYDPDSYIHDYFWSFGDNTHSQEQAPEHTYLVEDDHTYTVMLEVRDETGLWGRSIINVEVDQGTSSFPVTLNFVGDIMLARDYEADGGIIPTQGIEAIFEPTWSILGDAADLTIANLECPLTDQGESHPTKSVVFRGDPSNVTGLQYAGIDIITLANNHTLDYGMEGLLQTQELLDEYDIIHSGAGANSYQAGQPVFASPSGINIAFLASSDRTGQYNNAQPYLYAGLNKPGFAYMTPYDILQQIMAVEGVADLIVVEMHAGSEYSTSPGSHYDVAEFPLTVDKTERYSRTSGWGYTNINDPAPKAEDYSPRINVPHLWDRAIRQFTLDNGADLVVVHHPHKIHGLEVYNGKLIAHSLGNFVFDLDYPETYPTIILNAEIDQDGFSAFSLKPVYIDDYIPVPARGELGLFILNYLAHRSRELDTYLFVDRENIQGIVQLDTLSMERNNVYCRMSTDLVDNNSWMVSSPLRLPRNGSIAMLGEISPNANWEYRLGREKIWFGNFESEGSTEWALNDSGTAINGSAFLYGYRSLQHQLNTNSSDASTRLENRHPIEADSSYSLHGFLHGENSNNAEIQIAYYTSRYSSYPLNIENAGAALSGNFDWQMHSNQLNIPGNANYFDIRIISSPPDTGIGRTWFDDTGLIEWMPWRTWQSFQSITNPNDFYYIQIRTFQTVNTAEITFDETVYGSTIPVAPDFTSNIRSGKYPLTVGFSDASSGDNGWWYWDFGDNGSAINPRPFHTYTEPGIYTVRLTVHNNSGTELTVSKSNYIIVTADDPSYAGDINNDHAVNQIDIMVCIQIIFDLIEPDPRQFLAADMNKDLRIDLTDLLMISDKIHNSE